MSRTADVLNAFEVVVNNPTAALNALKWYMVKYPQHAAKAVGLEAPLVRIEIPVSVDANWRPAVYNLAQKNIDSWVRLEKSGKFVEAIKQCRADTGLGLKDAKDLVEYVTGHETTRFRGN